MGALAYLAGSTPQRLASAGSSVAIPILAVQQLNDIVAGGGLVAVSLGPSILAAPLVGVVLDRARRPGILIAVAGLLTAAAFLVAGFLGQVPLPVEFPALAVAGAVAPFYMGGLSSFVAGTIPDQSRAFAYDALSYNLSAVAGPALVAVMSAIFPAQAAMFVLSVAALLGSVCVAVIGLPAHGGSEHSVWRITLAGARHIFSTGSVPPPTPRSW